MRLVAPGLSPRLRSLARAGLALAAALSAGCTDAASARRADTGNGASSAAGASPQKEDRGEADAAAPLADAGSDPVDDADVASGTAVDAEPGAAPEADAGEPALAPEEGPWDPPPTVMSSEGRVVAIGDVHGDLEATRRALRLGGLIDDGDHWVGAHTVAVQVGDQLDRGDGERAILELFDALREEAHAAGGAFVALIGNHEQMNAQLDFRYVTEGGWLDFADVAAEGPADPRVSALPAAHRGRAVAFLPGGPYALRLARHNVIQIVDSTLFVHGGVLPVHVAAGLDALNAEHRAWLSGEGELSALWDSSNSPVWDRTYSDETTAADCIVLEDMLDQLGLARMVVAHTVQDNGINAVCDGRVYRVDVGLSAYYGGPLQVLEILGDTPTILE